MLAIRVVLYYTFMTQIGMNIVMTITITSILAKNFAKLIAIRQTLCVLSIKPLLERHTHVLGVQLCAATAYQH